MAINEWGVLNSIICFEMSNLELKIYHLSYVIVICKLDKSGFGLQKVQERWEESGKNVTIVRNLVV